VIDLGKAISLGVPDAIVTNLNELGGIRRTWLDVALYAALVVLLVRALTGLFLPSGPEKLHVQLFATIAVRIAKICALLIFLGGWFG